MSDKNIRNLIITLQKQGVSNDEIIKLLLAMVAKDSKKQQKKK